MSNIKNLLANNRAWSAQVQADDPEFFKRLATQQSPQYLWIGCADSRVPANQVTGLAPGEVFVHRNIANVVVNTDINCLSVLQYAVEVLKVTDVIVCGHYGCGGVRAALSGQRFGLIDNWLRNIKDVASRHSAELEALDEEARVDRLCELNVTQQVANLCRTTIVQGAWAVGAPLTVHGLIYGLADGRLKDLGIPVDSIDQLPEIYRMQY
jgi:carbonic anhydrase